MDVFEDFDDFLDNDLAEIVEFVNPERHPYTVRPRPNNLERWDEVEFVRRFRISKDSGRQMLAEIHLNLENFYDRNHEISPMEKLLLTLRFLASGSFYISIADFGGIHKSTAGKIISRVVCAIAECRPHHIKFPTTQEERNLSSIEFARFSRVIGAIDCTHIKLQSPGGDNEENFRNIKGYFSLNVQAICNAKACFVDVVARWPGAAHDTHIFNNSAVMMRFQAGEVAIVIAAAILHNIASRNNDDLPLEEVAVPNENLETEEVAVLRHQNDNATRRAIVGYFETLL